MNQGSIRKYLDTESDGYSTDENKRKRDEVSPVNVNIFKKSRKTSRTPTKSSGGAMGGAEEDKEMKEMLKIIMHEVKEIRREHAEHREEVAELKKQNEIMASEIKYLKGKVERLEVVEDRMEKIDRDNRRNNILVSGLELRRDTGEAAREDLQQFMKQSLRLDVDIIETHRIGDKLWVAKVKSFEGKLEILRSKHKLKQGADKRVFIGNDMTVHEREVQKKIRHVAEEEKRSGKVVKVGYQKIVIDGKRWIWNEKSQELEQAGEKDVTKNGTR